MSISNNQTRVNTPISPNSLSIKEVIAEAERKADDIISRTTNIRRYYDKMEKRHGGHLIY